MSCGCDTTKHNIADFQDYDNFVRYSPGMLVKTTDGKLWIAHNTNGAAGYGPTLENSIFLPVSPSECYDLNAPACGGPADPVAGMGGVLGGASMVGLPSLPQLPALDTKTMIAAAGAVLAVIILLR